MSMMTAFAGLDRESVTIFSSLLMHIMSAIYSEFINNIFVFVILKVFVSYMLLLNVCDQ